MMLKEDKNSQIKKIAFCEIIILLLGIVSFSFLISEIKLVNAQGAGDSTVASATATVIPAGDSTVTSATATVIPAGGSRVVVDTSNAHQKGFVKLTDHILDDGSSINGFYKLKNGKFVSRGGGEVFEDPNLLESVKTGKNVPTTANLIEPNTINEVISGNYWDNVGAYDLFEGFQEGRISSENFVEELKNLDSGKFGKVLDANPETLSITYEDGSSLDLSTGVLTSRTGTPTPYKYEVPILGAEVTNFFWGNLIQGAFWALGVYSLVKLVGSFDVLDDGEIDAAAYGAASGVFAAKIAYGTFGVATKSVSGSGGALAQFLTPLQATLIGIAVAAIVFVATYKKTKNKMEIVQFACFPWEPELGGEKCEICNEDPFRPCSEYRCRSLGQACEIVNPGTTEELCVWISKDDVTSPTIEPWKEVLKPEGLNYVPDGKRPPERGTKIQREGGACLQAFSPLQFGIKTNEPAQCKIDFTRKDKFDEMEYYFGENNLFVKNHSQIITVPSSEGTNSSGFVFPFEGDYEYFVRCRDKNGNENVDEYVISYCVDPSPDTTPPIIQGTSIPTESPVSFDTEEVEIELYVNEPADCKWGRQSKSYDDMENGMACVSEISQINSNLLYTCTGTLTGIENNKDNKFYFRCKDNPGKEEKDRFVMTQSYELLLKGTEPLTFKKFKPDMGSVITGATSTVVVNLGVETSNGAEEGKSICYFSNNGNSGSFIPMFETNNFLHNQKLDLVSGNYEYFYRCIDAGGNLVENSTEFSVFIDKEPPKITRAYRDGGLKIVTNEDSNCVYSLSGCDYNFDDGLPMIYSNPGIKNNHFSDWNSNNIYHIKCQDKFGNEPNPNECSIVANGVDFSE